MFPVRLGLAISLLTRRFAIMDSVSLIQMGCYKRVPRTHSRPGHITLSDLYVLLLDSPI